jgi:hypothetical protein
MDVVSSVGGGIWLRDIYITYGKIKAVREIQISSDFDASS